MRRLLLLGALIVGFQATALAADSARGAAVAFLDWHARTQPSGAPSEAEQAQLASLVSDELLCLLKAANRYYRVYRDKFPDEKPPYVEGDLFLSSVYEPPEKTEIELVVEREGTATALVKFSAAENFDWRDRLHLRLEKGEWKLADVDRLGPYQNREGQFSFGGQAGSMARSFYAAMDRNQPVVRWRRSEVGRCKALRRF